MCDSQPAWLLGSRRGEKEKMWAFKGNIVFVKFRACVILRDDATLARQDDVKIIYAKKYN